MSLNLDISSKFKAIAGLKNKSATDLKVTDPDPQNSLDPANIQD